MLLSSCSARREAHTFHLESSSGLLKLEKTCAATKTQLQPKQRPEFMEAPLSRDSEDTERKRGVFTLKDLTFSVWGQREKEKTKEKKLHGTKLSVLSVQLITGCHIVSYNAENEWKHSGGRLSRTLTANQQSRAEWWQRWQKGMINAKITRDKTEGCLWRSMLLELLPASWCDLWALRGLTDKLTLWAELAGAARAEFYQDSVIRFNWPKSKTLTVGS